MAEHTLSNAELFELELSLPDPLLTERATRLIGFTPRYDQLRGDMRLLTDKEGLDSWRKKFYDKQIPIVAIAADRYPLIIFHGDVGTGKTAVAEAAANQLAKDLKKDAMLFKLSTRVRGSGQVGQMSMLINQAFDVVAKEVGKTRLAFLILDEADSLAASRETDQSHHEDKVAVNTLIQKIDDMRRFGGRILIFLCTNRFEALDPAILRRAARIEQFDRPNEQQREELLRLDCEGLGLSDSTIRELVALTGPHGASQSIVFTFSDLRTRLIPEALSRAFPDRALKPDDFIEAARMISPSPSMTKTQNGRSNQPCD